MKYGILSILFAWIFPTRADRQTFRKFCKSIDNRAEIKRSQNNYPKIINDIKQNPDKKIKVLFLVNEISKWKTQSLYDLMIKSENFEPAIALTIADRQKRLSKEEKIKCLDENYEYFTRHGMKCIFVWNKEKNKALPLDKPGAKIVFYQQPWFLPKIQQPAVVSKYALTCYVPYFVPNYGILSMDCRDFHKFLFRNYVLNKDWEEIYKEYFGEVYGANIRSVGHTMLDRFCLNRNTVTPDNCVIYAPHWSVPYEGNRNDENYSTFLWFGKIMLNYAQNHPEIKWVFKPHPTLKFALKKTKLFTDSEIENYYNEWAKIGQVCETGDYTEIFLKSKAMITDCGSFLIEYFCTGKPVIHLISDFCKAVPPAPSRKILNTFYQVRNTGELYNELDNILRRNNDYKKDERLKVLKKLNLDNCCAAQNIMTDLETAAGLRRE